MVEVTDTGEAAIDTPAIEDRTEEQLLRLFFGRNAEKFIIYHREDRDWFVHRKPTQNLISAFEQMNFVAMFFPVAWFFYRRMYLYGALIFLSPIVIGMLFPQFIKSLNMGLAGAIGYTANRVYFYFARSRVLRIERRADLSVLSRNDLIKRTGGTSILGAILGSVLTAAILFLIFASVLRH